MNMPSTSAENSSSQSHPIKTAIIGLGRSGWGIHGKELSAREDYQIVAVSDPDEKHRQEMSDQLACPGFASIDELLAQTEAELVVVATPNHFHPEDARKVLQAGAHCVLEKPIASSYAEAESLLEISRQTGLHIFPHHQLRVANEFRFLQEIIGRGILGPIFEIRFAWGGYARRNDWQVLAKYQGGLLNNHGPHAIDMILNLADSPVTHIQSEPRHVKDAGDVDDHFHLFMKTEKNQILDVMVSSSMAIPMPRTMILGAYGALQAQDNRTARLRYYDPAAMPKIEAQEEFGPGVKETLPWVEETLAMEPSTAPGNFYDQVTNTLRHNKPFPISLESASEVVRVLEIARSTPPHFVV